MLSCQCDDFRSKCRFVIRPVRFLALRRLVLPENTAHRRSDKQTAVRERIEAAGTALLFLPPYSSDFNPLEKAFSRLKAMLRKAGERTVSGLSDLIGKLVDIFQPTECANYFSSCGYDAD